MVTELPPSQFASAKIVIVEVGLGAGAKKYSLHKDALTAHSDYFRKALQGPWKESQERVVRLDDVDRDGFDEFVNYIYSYEMTIICPEEKESENDLALRYINLIKALVIADRHLVTESAM